MESVVDSSVAQRQSQKDKATLKTNMYVFIYMLHVYSILLILHEQIGPKIDLVFLITNIFHTLEHTVYSK